MKNYRHPIRQFYSIQVYREIKLNRHIINRGTFLYLIIVGVYSNRVRKVFF
jgi:hypothetical protein